MNLGTILSLLNYYLGPIVLLGWKIASFLMATGPGLGDPLL
jgi:hypothetical protein